jgi:hypothetical protein
MSRFATCAPHGRSPTERAAQFNVDGLGDVARGFGLARLVPRRGEIGFGPYLFLGLRGQFGHDPSEYAHPALRLLAMV